jgi:Na+-driven multidrug efflux pump
MIVRIGIPAALQMALTAFSNVFVQSYIANVNADKTACLGGWTSYSKIDQFIFLPVQSLALATTTFVGQNLGIGDVKRAKKGTLIAYLMSTAAASAIIVTVMAFAPTLAGIFNPDPGVVHYATLLLRTVTPFYLCTSVNQIFSAALRGAGNTRAPMIIMLCSFVGFRQLYLFVMSNYISNELLPVAMGYPAGWLACAITTLIYYLTFSFEKSRLIRPSASR